MVSSAVTIPCGLPSLAACYIEMFQNVYKENLKRTTNHCTKLFTYIVIQKKKKKKTWGHLRWGLAGTRVFKNTIFTCSVNIATSMLQTLQYSCFRNLASPLGIYWMLIICRIFDTHDPLLHLNPNAFQQAFLSKYIVCQKIQFNYVCFCLP